MTLGKNVSRTLWTFGMLCVAFGYYVIGNNVAGILWQPKIAQQLQAYVEETLTSLWLKLKRPIN
ncbi:MAG: hypothetical protein ABIH34_04835 [Nanoarchaeota archaeon]